MRVIFLTLFFSVLPLCAAFAAEPELRSGDLIFQTSRSKQSYAIMWASKSLFSHVGVVEVAGGKTYVVEAIAKVSRTPLEKWIRRGRLGRYAVYRYGGLDSNQERAVVQGAHSFLGRGYDIFFTSRNREIYCSELVHLAFGKAGLPLGQFEKVKDLDVDNLVVRQLVQKRWRKHPLCRTGVKTFDDCWQKMLNDELLSPERLAQDSHLQKIYSNYP